MTKDPVCGMTIEETTSGGTGWNVKAVATTTYQGKAYYFCSDACKTRFLHDPARYAESGQPVHH